MKRVGAVYAVDRAGVYANCESRMQKWAHQKKVSSCVISRPRVEGTK